MAVNENSRFDVAQLGHRVIRKRDQRHQFRSSQLADLEFIRVPHVNHAEPGGSVFEQPGRLGGADFKGQGMVHDKGPILPP